MRIRYSPNSRPVRPWVRLWMVWVMGFVLQFLPRFFCGVISAPATIARYEWADLRDEVASFDFTTKDPKT